MNDIEQIRKPRAKLVTLTDAASNRVREILDEKDEGFLRVGVQNGGCAGMEYLMDYIRKNLMKLLRIMEFKLL